MGHFRTVSIMVIKWGLLKQSTWNVDGLFQKGTVHLTLSSACFHKPTQNPQQLSQLPHPAPWVSPPYCRGHYRSGFFLSVFVPSGSHLILLRPFAEEEVLGYWCLTCGDAVTHSCAFLNSFSKFALERGKLLTHISFREVINSPHEG